MEFHDKPSPMTEQGRQRWESAFGPMPQDLEVLLLESDGPILYEKSNGKELQFLSSNQAVDYYSAYGFHEFCADAIPIAMDGCGNFAVYRIEKGRVMSIFGMSAGNLGWEDGAFLCDTVSALIELPERIESRIQRCFEKNNM